MRKKNTNKGKEPKFEKEKIEKHKKRHPNGGVKSCLGCSKDFLSIDVCNNRICVDCARLISKEWLPNTYKSGASGHSEPDDWF